MMVNIHKQKTRNRLNKNINIQWHKQLIIRKAVEDTETKPIYITGQMLLRFTEGMNEWITTIFQLYHCENSIFFMGCDDTGRRVDPLRHILTLSQPSLALKPY